MPNSLCFAHGQNKSDQEGTDRAGAGAESCAVHCHFQHLLICDFTIKCVRPTNMHVLAQEITRSSHIAPGSVEPPWYRNVPS